MYQNQITISQNIMNAISLNALETGSASHHSNKLQNKTMENDLDQNRLSGSISTVIKTKAYFPGQIITEQAKEFTDNYYNEIRFKSDEELLKQKEDLKPKSFWGKIIFHIDLYSKAQYHQIDRVLTERTTPFSVSFPQP